LWLIENIDSRLDLILEAQKGVWDDIKDIGRDYKKLSDRIDRAEIRLDVIDAR